MAHYHGDHEHDHEIGSPPNHHDHSSKSNRWMGRFMVAVGAVVGSYSLVAAGVHNEADGVVHYLRSNAENTSSSTRKFAFRIGAGMLLIAGGLGLHYLEKFIPAESVAPITPVIFVGETLINGNNTIKHIKSGSASHDTHIGLAHNGLDTATSVASAALTGASLFANPSSPLAEQIVGTGHTALMATLGAYSVVKAMYFNSKDRHAHTTGQET
ncbi:hypothetical protein KC930_02070 [Candidatus Saccharibacteria bacterium]|nr:hypothetical protein [Candidatus Saccharibacteria bacterium]